MVGRDVKGEDFLDLFARASRRKVEDFFSSRPKKASRRSPASPPSPSAGSPVHLELLLLPFAPSVLSPQSVTGSLVTLGVAAEPEPSPLARFLAGQLAPCRHTARCASRAVRRLALAKGLMVYEGLRERALDHIRTSVPDCKRAR